MIKQYHSSSSKETERLGQEFSACLKNGDVIALSGDLGVGKTVFVKGIAKGLNIRELITSPTFNIVREYEGDLKLFHFDVYRIDDPQEMDDTGYFDYINDGVCVIEWADNIADILPRNHFEVRIEREGNDGRLINIIWPEEGYNEDTWC